MWIFFRFLLLVFVVLQLNQLMSEITLGELTIFGEDSKLDALLGNYYHHFSFGNLYSAAYWRRVVIAMQISTIVCQIRWLL